MHEVLSVKARKLSLHTGSSNQALDLANHSDSLIVSGYERKQILHKKKTWLMGHHIKIWRILSQKEAFGWNVGAKRVFWVWLNSNRADVLRLLLQRQRRQWPTHRGLSLHWGGYSSSVEVHIRDLAQQSALPLGKQLAGSLGAAAACSRLLSPKHTALTSASSSCWKTCLNAGDTTALQIYRNQISCIFCRFLFGQW